VLVGRSLLTAMQPVIFFNTGWMEAYAGLHPDHDPLRGGGAHNQEQGWGGEIFNLQPYRGKLYGFVRTSHGGTIRLERLGGAKSATQLDQVTVVWTAPRPQAEGGGTYVVGWYCNATVFRSPRPRPSASRHRWDEEPIAYYAVAKQADVTLLPADERLLLVPRSRLGSMGRSHVWYAEADPDFVQRVLTYIASGGRLPPPKRRGKPNLLQRLAVEKRAVEITQAYYSELGYELHSVERDKVGWDLTATSGRVQLKLEVKGTAGSAIAAELTANEYRNLLMDGANYRICLVTNALTTPTLHVFAYSARLGRWVSQAGLLLEIEPLTSARLYAGR
jgi:hypothetical protein